MKIKWLSKKRPEPLQEKIGLKRYIHEHKIFDTVVGCRSIRVESGTDSIVICMANEDDVSQDDMWCIAKKDVPVLLQILREATDFKPPEPIEVKK